MVSEKDDRRYFDHRCKHFQGLDDLSRAQLLADAVVVVEVTIQPGISALVHIAPGTQQPFDPDGLVEPPEHRAASRMSRKQQADRRIDDHIRADVLELAAFVREVTEHRVHQLVRDQAEQVCRTRDVLLGERGVTSHDAMGVDAGRGTAFFLLHVPNEGRDEAVWAKGASNHFSDSLQIHLHCLCLLWVKTPHGAQFSRGASGWGL